MDYLRYGKIDLDITGANIEQIINAINTSTDVLCIVQRKNVVSCYSKLSFIRLAVCSQFSNRKVAVDSFGIINRS